MRIMNCTGGGNIRKMESPLGGIYIISTQLFKNNLSMRGYEHGRWCSRPVEYMNIIID